MAAPPARVDSSPLSSEFEDLGMDDEASKSTAGGGGDSDWTESAEELVSKSRATSATSGSGTSQGASPAAARLQQPPGSQHMQTAARRPLEAQIQTQLAASRTAGSRQTRQSDDDAYSTLKEIEDAGLKVAHLTKQATSDLTKKLFGGGSAGAGGGGAAEEGFSISKITEGVSSWWSALDPSSLVPDVGPSTAAASPVQAKSDAQQLFGLPPTEEVLEKFTCALVQTYSCRHNAFTGPREVTWPGMLYISDRHSCFKAQRDDTTLMLPHTDVGLVEKAEKGGKGSLRIGFGSEGEHLVLWDFSGGTEGLDGALALLEHVTAGS